VPPVVYTATRPATSAKTSAVETIEIEYRTPNSSDSVTKVTFVILLDCLQSGHEVRALLDGALTGIRTECHNATRPIADRLRAAIEEANKAVYTILLRYAAVDNGVSVIIAAISESDRHVPSMVGELQIAFNGNCRCYLWKGTAKQPDQLHSLTTAHTWGQENLARGFVREGDRSDYAQWDKPLRYLGANRTIQADQQMQLPAGSSQTRSNALQLQEGDQVILCTVAVADNMVANMVKTREGDPRRFTQTLVKTQGETQGETQGDLSVALLHLNKSKGKTDWPRAILDTWWGLRRWSGWLVGVALLLGIIYGGWYWVRPSTIGPQTLVTQLRTLPRRLQKTILDWASGSFPALPDDAATAEEGVDGDAVTTVTPVTVGSIITPTLVPATDTAVPSNTHTPIPSVTPSQTPIPTVMQSTPMPSATAANTNTPMPLPTATHTPVPSATANHTAISTAVVDETSPSHQSSVSGLVQLQSPNNGDTAIERITFSWTTNVVLADGQAFELILWQAGENPLQEGKGWGGPTTSTQTDLNFPALNLPEGDYFWGVRLIEHNPFKSLQMLSDGRLVHVKRLSRPEPTATQHPRDE